jgi:hypothetical protein
LTDPTITIGLATLAVAVTIALQTLRATHYDGKLEGLKTKLSGWLQQIENELKSELKTLVAQASPDPSIDKIVEIVSKFSAVKEMDQRVGELHTSNENSIRSSIVVVLFVIGLAAGTLFSTDIQLIEFGVFLGILVWGGSVYYVHRFIGEYNALCETERKRQV